MCDVCRRQFCPPSCPEYRGRSAARGEAVGMCRLCQSSIYKGEDYFSDGEVRICGDCARYISVDEIKALCGFGSEGELLERLGFEMCHEDQM